MADEATAAGIEDGSTVAVEAETSRDTAVAESGAMTAEGSRDVAVESVGIGARQAEGAGEQASDSVAAVAIADAASHDRAAESAAPGLMEADEVEDRAAEGAVESLRRVAMDGPASRGHAVEGVIKSAVATTMERLVDSTVETMVESAAESAVDRLVQTAVEAAGTWPALDEAKGAENDDDDDASAVAAFVDRLLHPATSPEARSSEPRGATGLAEDDGLRQASPHAPVDSAAWAASSADVAFDASATAAEIVSRIVADVLQSLVAVVLSDTATRNDGGSNSSVEPVPLAPPAAPADAAIAGDGAASAPGPTPPDRVAATPTVASAASHGLSQAWNIQAPVFVATSAAATATLAPTPAAVAAEVRVPSTTSAPASLPMPTQQAAPGAPAGPPASSNGLASRILSKLTGKSLLAQTPTTIAAPTPEAAAALKNDPAAPTIPALLVAEDRGADVASATSLTGARPAVAASAAPATPSAAESEPAASSAPPPTSPSKRRSPPPPSLEKLSKWKVGDLCDARSQRDFEWRPAVIREVPASASGAAGDASATLAGMYLVSYEEAPLKLDVEQGAVASPSAAPPDERVPLYALRPYGSAPPDLRMLMRNQYRDKSTAWEVRSGATPAATSAAAASPTSSTPESTPGPSGRGRGATPSPPAAVEREQAGSPTATGRGRGATPPTTGRGRGLPMLMTAAALSDPLGPLRLDRNMVDKSRISGTTYIDTTDERRRPSALLPLVAAEARHDDEGTTSSARMNGGGNGDDFSSSSSSRATTRSAPSGGSQTATPAAPDSNAVSASTKASVPPSNAVGATTPSPPAAATTAGAASTVPRSTATAAKPTTAPASPPATGPPALIRPPTTRTLWEPPVTPAVTKRVPDFVAKSRNADGQTDKAPAATNGRSPDSAPVAPVVSVLTRPAPAARSASPPTMATPAPPTRPLDAPVASSPTSPQPPSGSTATVASPSASARVSASAIRRPWRRGDRCEARYLEDGCWYEALVENVDAHTGRIAVVFVDYGNRDAVDPDDVRPFPGAAPGWGSAALDAPAAPAPPLGTAVPAPPRSAVVPPYMPAARVPAPAPAAAVETPTSTPLAVAAKPARLPIAPVETTTPDEAPVLPLRSAAPLRTPALEGTAAMVSAVAAPAETARPEATWAGVPRARAVGRDSVMAEPVAPPPPLERQPWQANEPCEVRDIVTGQWHQATTVGAESPLGQVVVRLDPSGDVRVATLARLRRRPVPVVAAAATVHPPAVAWRIGDSCEVFWEQNRWHRGMVVALDASEQGRRILISVVLPELRQTIQVLPSALRAVP